MREIKFRGKRLDNGKWVIGNLLTFGVHTSIVTEVAEISMQEYEVTPQTVGQFTGLLDKNGKKIFEGDMVNAIAVAKFASQTCVSDVICSIEESHQFCIRSGVGGIYNRDVKFGLHIKWSGWKSLEIIGNIHDDSELIE